MLRRPNIEIAECYQHARDCAEHANSNSDLKVSDRFRLLEQGWLKVAHSMAAADRFTAFIRRGKLKIH